MKIATNYNQIVLILEKGNLRHSKLVDIWQKYLVGFFVGAIYYKSCGYWVYIVKKLGTYYHLCWNGGTRYNNKVEIISLLGILYCARWLSIEHIDVYGESNATIEQVLRKIKFVSPLLIKWIKCINMLLMFFRTSLLNISTQSIIFHKCLIRVGLQHFSWGDLFRSFVQWPSSQSGKYSNDINSYC